MKRYKYPLNANAIEDEAILVSRKEQLAGLLDIKNPDKMVMNEIELVKSEIKRIEDHLAQFGRIEMTDDEISQENADLSIIREAQASAITDMKDNAIRLAMTTEADPLFYKWQAGEIEKQEWLDKRAEIRQRFSE